MGDLKGLQERLGYEFRNAKLLELALTHPSIAHEQDAVVETNQRLEFLGDAVLGLVLTRELYEKFFRGYTNKQWGLDPSQLDAAVKAMN